MWGLASDAQSAWMTAFTTAFFISLSLSIQHLALRLYAKCFQPISITHPRSAPPARQSDGKEKRVHLVSSHDPSPDAFQLPAPVVQSPSEAEVLKEIVRCIRTCLSPPRRHTREMRGSPSRQARVAPSATCLRAPDSPVSIIDDLNCRVAHVLPPACTSLCSASLERHPTLYFEMLRVTAHGAEYQDNGDIPSCLAFCEAALGLGEPMLALYDFRQATLPPWGLGRKLLDKCLRWADKHARAWDSQVQALAIILPNPLVRGFLNMCAKLVQPPQPVCYCASEDEALAFLCTVTETRSFVKASYKR